MYVLWERDREGVRGVVVRERLCVSVCVVEVGVFCFVCVCCGREGQKSECEVGVRERGVNVCV